MLKFVIFGLCAYLIYFVINSESIDFERPSLTEVERFEGPHIIEQQGQYQLVNALEQNEQMTLKVDSIAKPTSVDVYKPGDQALTFSVPIKTQISIPPVSYEQPQRLFAMSDVEGNFNTVTSMLKQYQVIDTELNWSFGNGHMVIIGDVFDRGNHVTELLWLLYRLDSQAIAAGGRLHMLIGNHEMMNLQNDLRYVEPKYLAFNELLNSQLNLNYVDLFGDNTELGKWLRSRNIIEKIGDTLYTHGGVSPAMSDNQLSLAYINQAMRDAIDVKKADRNEQQTLLFGRNGPMWYRGYFMTLPMSLQIGDEDLSKVLAYYQAKKIAVGHTIVDKPQRFYDGRVIAVDVKHPADHLLSIPARTSYGVMYDNGQWFVVDDQGEIEGI